MNREDVPELHNIQPIGALPSIFERGLLCHDLAERIPHTSIANEAVQAKRAAVTIPFTDGSRRRLHSYANLYLHGRNPMMYFLRIALGHQALCVLRIANEVLDIPGVLITDRNAACDAVRFSLSPQGLAHLDRDVVLATSWNDPDPIAKQEKKQIRCAEVLVPNQLPVEFIRGIYTSCEDSTSAVQRLGLPCPVEMKPALFFC